MNPATVPSNTNPPTAPQMRRVSEALCPPTALSEARRLADPQRPAASGFLPVSRTVTRTMRVGTSHFPSLALAALYYRDYGLTPADVNAKIDAGEIHIGEPPVKAGERVVLIDAGRPYAIECEMRRGDERRLSREARVMSAAVATRMEKGLAVVDELSSLRRPAQAGRPAAERTAKPLGGSDGP